MSALDLDTINQVNRCQMSEMGKVAKQLDPSHVDSCAIFGKTVRNVQAAIVHTYQLTAFAAVRRASPQEAADLWKNMVELCEAALQTLLTLKDLFPNCGTYELYDLTLDYRKEAEERYNQNLQDTKCQNLPIPAGLFPTKNSAN